MRWRGGRSCAGGGGHMQVLDEKGRSNSGVERDCGKSRHMQEGRSCADGTAVSPGICWRGGHVLMGIAKGSWGVQASLASGITGCSCPRVWASKLAGPQLSTNTLTCVPHLQREDITHSVHPFKPHGFPPLSHTPTRSVHPFKPHGFPPLSHTPTRSVHPFKPHGFPPLSHTPTGSVHPFKPHPHPRLSTNPTP